MLDAEMKAEVGEYLQRLVTPVEITAYLDDTRESADMLSLLADISAASAQGHGENKAVTAAGVFPVLRSPLPASPRGFPSRACRWAMNSRR